MADQLIAERASRAIQEAALRHVGRERAHEFVLYIDERALPAGTWLGPRHAGVPGASQRAVMVFVDEEPAAGFAHACRYLLFDPATAALIAEHAARFPPYPEAWPANYHRFGPRRHPARRVAGQIPESGGIPIGSPGGPAVQPGRPQQPLMSQGGRRLAVFFAGTPDPSTLNTMEFGYRTLMELGYKPSDIRVANHLGHSPPKCAKWINAAVSPTWAGADGQPFTMRVDHPGSRAGFRAALAELVPGRQDSLFIHTGGHGENDAGSSSLSTIVGPYHARQFKDDLQDLVKVRELVVVMQQCFSGGFRHAVLTSGAAGGIAFASAAEWETKAYNDLDNDSDFAWNSFARDWFGAQNGGYVRNGALSVDPDSPPAGNNDGHIAALEAFRYAKQTPFAHPMDLPQHGYKPLAVPASQQLRLDGSHAGSS